MKRRFIVIVSALTFGIIASAQTPYLNALYSMQDLIGDARYVGMGGATGALGANMSSISVNPAGIGLYRRSDVAMSISVLTQGEKPDLNADMTHLSFDQLGYVFSMPMDGAHVKYLNFALNYKKKANFNQSYIADNHDIGGLSQTQQMADLWNNTSYSTPLADLMYEAYLLNPVYGDDGTTESFDGLSSEKNLSDRTTEGRIDNFDLNMSMNIDNRFFLGFTLGVDNIDYYSYSTYSELGTVSYSDGSSASDIEYYTLYNTESVTGYGANFKLGAIVFPIENSPFRIGLAIESPTFYHLDYLSATSIDSPMYEEDGELYIGTSYDNYSTDYSYEKLRLKVRTPWKVRASLAHTFDTFLAIGAEYEYANYGKTKQGFDDFDGDGYFQNSNNDADMNALTRATLRGSHSFKLGLEYNLSSNFALRFGYNFYSSMYKSDARLDQTNPSSAFNYISTTDFINRGNVNIFTAGLGYHTAHFYADMAYKYRNQSGDFYAFDDTYLSSSLSPVEVNFDTHEVFFTVGYKF